MSAKLQLPHAVDVQRQQRRQKSGLGSDVDLMPVDCAMQARDHDDERDVPVEYLSVAEQKAGPQPEVYFYMMVSEREGAVLEGGDQAGGDRRKKVQKDARDKPSSRDECAEHSRGGGCRQEKEGGREEDTAVAPANSI